MLTFVCLCLWGQLAAQEGVFNACGIHSLFSMCPRGWKAAESSNRDSLPHALHGKSSEIKGFVCTANNKDSSLHNLPKRKDDSVFFFLSCNFYRYDFVAKQAVDNLFFFCSSACSGQVEQSVGRKQLPSKCLCECAE